MEKRTKIRNQMDGNLEASEDTRDSKVANHKSIKNLHETDVKLLAKNLNMDERSTENPPEVNVKKKKNKKKMKKIEEEKPEIRNQMDGNLEASEDNRDSEVANHKLRHNLLETDVTGQVLAENLKTDEGSTENPPEGNVKKKRKKRKKKKIEEEEKPEIRNQMDRNLEASEDTRYSEVVDHKSRQNLLGADVTVQLLAENLKVDEGSTESLPAGNVNKKKRKKKNKKPETKTQIDGYLGASEDTRDSEVANHKSRHDLLDTDVTVQVLAENLKIDEGSTENSPEGSVKKKRKKKKKQMEEEEKPEIRNQMDGNLEASEDTRDSEVANHKSRQNLLGTDVTMQLLAENLKVDGSSAENLPEGNFKKRKRKRKNKEEMEEEKPETINQIDGYLGASEDTRDSEVAHHRLRQNPLETDVTVQLLAENMKMDEGSTENLQAGNVKKRKRKKKKEENHKSETNLLEMGVTIQLLAENLKTGEGSTDILPEGNVKKKKKLKQKEKARVKAEMDSVGRIKSDAESTENIVEGTVTGLKKGNLKDDVQSVDQIKMDIGPTENIAEGNGIGNIKSKRRRIKKAEIADEVQSVDQMKMDADPIENVAEGNVIGEGKIKRKRIKKAKTKDEERSMDQTKKDTHPIENLAEGNKITSEGRDADRTKMDTDSLENIAEGKKGSSEGNDVISTRDEKVGTHFSSFDVKDGKCLYLKTQIPSIKRKLVVLDVNGLLADIVKPAPPHRRGDIHIYGRNFDVGIWSSRSKLILDAVVNPLLGDLKYKLLFCWNMSHSTQTGFKTLENHHKPLVCKELSKIWENDNPNFPWKKGDYNESNTLLLDDSPYKALLNPLHTAIFPHSYSYRDKNDKSLGPGGDLRVYLEGLLESENVQKYVEQHPFGQRAINEHSSSWGFYAEVLQHLSNRFAARSTANKRPNTHIKLT